MKCFITNPNSHPQPRLHKVITCCLKGAVGESECDEEAARKTPRYAELMPADTALTTAKVSHVPGADQQKTSASRGRSRPPSQAGHSQKQRLA